MDFETRRQVSESEPENKERIGTQGGAIEHQGYLLGVSVGSRNFDESLVASHLGA
jgi:hypothetical protein